jgi:hypothetical protein
MRRQEPGVLGNTTARVREGGYKERNDCCLAGDTNTENLDGNAELGDASLQASYL